MLHSWEALIAWTPVYWTVRTHFRTGKEETIGMVRIGRMDRDGRRPDWHKGYALTVGACFSDCRRLRGAESIMMMFIDFHTMVVRDGIDPKVAHTAFLSIKEYRERISSDIKGADHA
jgi:hypothetical protein